MLGISRPKKKSKSGKVKDSSSLTEMVLPKHASPTAVAARNDIRMMWRVFKHANSTKLLNVFTYAELLGLSASWFSKVCPFPLMLC
jgi:hypothetical protein